MRIRATCIAIALSACFLARGEQPEHQHFNLETSDRFTSVFVSDLQLESLKEAVKARQAPAFDAFQSLMEFAEDNLDREARVLKEWYIPGFYVDAEGHRTAKNGLRDDANAAYALALSYRMTGQVKYARSAVFLIDAWVRGVEKMDHADDSMLSFSYHFPAFIFAADLLRDEEVWPKDQQAAFIEFLRDKALPMNTMHVANNWGNWGLVLAASCAVYLKEEPLFDQCVERWKYFIGHQIAGDGHLPHEVHRSEGQRGIWYSHFSLMPQTIAAEILSVNGIDLYDYRAPGGSTLKQAFERIAQWTSEPESFPYWKGDPGKLMGVRYFSYFEILNARWPNDAATGLLMDSRPMTANHSAPFLTFTHGRALQ